ncbi:hypothetical protein Z949_1906 [Sulfitobacter guttiformis KCTC 32187]|nr:hypothetical protein Z949_1906 [Sulfitobacter guttiformis KCTC 32187]
MIGVVVTGGRWVFLRPSDSNSTTAGAPMVAVSLPDRLNPL